MNIEGFRQLQANLRKPDGLNAEIWKADLAQPQAPKQWNLF